MNAQNDLAVRLADAFPAYTFHLELTSGQREGTLDFTVIEGAARKGLLKITEEFIDDSVDIISDMKKHNVLFYLDPKRPVYMTTRGIK